MMAPHNVPSIRSEALSYAAPQEKVAYGALLLVQSFCEGVYMQVLCPQTGVPSFMPTSYDTYRYLIHCMCVCDIMSPVLQSC